MFYCVLYLSNSYYMRSVADFAPSRVRSLLGADTPRHRGDVGSRSTSRRASERARRLPSAMGILSKGVHKSYEVGKTIGKGSFAVVKEGKHKASGTKVAIKVVDKKDAVFDPESLEQEISTMKAVSHPSCVLLHEVYDEPNKTYLVLDLITGGTVMDRIIAIDHFSEKDAASVTADVLSAVQVLCV